MNFTKRTFRKSSAQFIKIRLPLQEVAIVKKVFDIHQSEIWKWIKNL